MFRQMLLAAAGSGRVKRLVTTAPYSRGVVARFVAGETLEEVLGVAERLRADGLLVTIDHLGEDTREPGQAAGTVKHYVTLLDRLAERGLSHDDGVEVSVKPTAVGLRLGPDGPRIARAHIAEICAAARAAGTTVTLDMEDHGVVADTLALLRDLRTDWPELGAVIQSYLRSAEGHCAELAVPGSRVRLCKGAYAAPPSVAFSRPREVDLSYVRCLRTLMAGPGYPMIATHDPRLIEIADSLAARHDRAPGSFEYQMLYGIRQREQRRLAEAGAQVRVYVPYGADWYGYLMRRLAERPANLAFFLRSLARRG